MLAYSPLPLPELKKRTMLICCSAMTIRDLLKSFLEVINCPMVYHKFDQPFMRGIANMYKHGGFQTYYDNAVFYTKTYANGVRPSTSTAFNEQMAQGLGNIFSCPNTFEYPNIGLDYSGIYNPYIPSPPSSLGPTAALCTNPATESG